MSGPQLDVTDNADGAQDNPRLIPLSTVARWILLVVTLALLTTGRWGSYLGWPGKSVFVTDLALLGAGLATVGHLLANRNLASRLVLLAMLPISLIVGYAAVRLAVSSRDLNSLRDAAPYIYGAVALMVVVVGVPKRTRWLVPLATVAHAAWVTASLNDPDLNYRMPTVGRTRIFELRTDFDATVAGLLAVACVLLALSAESWLARSSLLLIAAWSGLLVPAMNNRAGLLATAVAALWASLRVYRRSHWRRRHSPRARRLVAGAAAGALALMAALVLAYTPAGQRMVGTFSADPSSEQRTTDARIEVYRRVLGFVDETPTRVLVGVGFGPDYLKEIGASPIYDPGGDLRVRSPHNFLLGTYARLGILGAVLQAAMVAWGYVLAWRATRVHELDAVHVLAGALLVALPVAAAVGVVLESPFGAVPYYWAYGALVVRLVAQPALERGGNAAVGSQTALSVR